MPTLTPEQIATMQAEVEELNNTPNPATVEAQIIQKQNADNVNNIFFSDDDQNIIIYETESKNIDGDFPTLQIVEQDIVDCANKTGRIYDGNDIFRHDAFDGIPVSHTTENETENKPLIYGVIDELENGFSFPPLATLTIDAWSGGTGIADNNLPNGKYVINDAVVLVTNSVADAPNYNITYTELVAGTISIGDSVDGHVGFNDSERTNKIATNPDLQGLMIYQLGRLDALLVTLVSYLNSIVTALQGTTDPDFSPSTLTAHTDYRVAINAYKATLNISDSDIVAIKLIIDARTAFLLIRIGEIDTRLSSLRDTRYNWAYVRANAEEGSLSIQSGLAATKIIIDAKVVSMTAQKTFYETNLPLA